MTHVYLRHENAAGSGDGVELYPGNSYFLPDEAPNTQVIDVVETMDLTHSVTKLGIYERDVLVSVYGSGGTEVVEGGGIGRYKVPISTRDGQSQILIVLRRGDQILTPSGRWSLVWRTGESQMPAPVQAMHSDGDRSFDPSLEIEDSQSQDEESPMPHDPSGNFVMSMEDTGYGMPALASVLMPPPPLPRVDILLDTPGEDRGDETASEEDVDEHGADEITLEKDAVTHDARPLSQGTRVALSELSTNSVIMLRTNVSGPSVTLPLLHGIPQRDENGNLQYPDGATSPLKELIDDINARRTSQCGRKDEDEVALSDHGKFEEYANNTEGVDGHEEDERTRGVYFEASVGVDSHVSDSTEVLHSQTMTAVHEKTLETHEDPLALANARSDHDPGSSTSGTERRSLAEPERATENEHTFVSSPAFDPLLTEEPIIRPQTRILPSSSGSSGKRKAITSPRKESVPNKRSRVTFKERPSDQEDEEEQSITVEVVPKRKRTIPSNDSPRRTTRTAKSTMRSLPPASSTPSRKKRIGRNPRSDMVDSIPSRSRSTSTTSSSRFEEYLGSPPRVLFASSTTVDCKKDTMKDFKRLGVEVVDDINQANMLIVGGAELKKTAKFIIAVARGIDVVSERWIVESRRKDVLLDIIPFVPEDDAHETEWGFKLIDATARGKEGVVQELLHDTTVYTTKDLERFPAARDLPSIVKALGGNIVKSSLPYGKSRTNNVLILGTRDDSQAVEVHRIGHKLFDKDLVILGALRGKIDTELSEFEIGVHVKEEELD